MLVSPERNQSSSWIDRLHVQLLGGDAAESPRRGRSASDGRRRTACRCRCGRSSRRRGRARRASDRDIGAWSNLSPQSRCGDLARKPRRPREPTEAHQRSRLNQQRVRLPRHPDALVEPDCVRHGDQRHRDLRSELPPGLVQQVPCRCRAFAPTRKRAKLGEVADPGEIGHRPRDADDRISGRIEARRHDEVGGGEHFLEPRRIVDRTRRAETGFDQDAAELRRVQIRFGGIDDARFLTSDNPKLLIKAVARRCISCSCQGAKIAAALCDLGRKRLYSSCRGNPAMAINGQRNKPIGPGGSTRRLHHERSFDLLEDR